MSILEVKGLSHSYGSDTPFVNDAVSNVSFSIEKGEIIGIIGTSPGSAPNKTRDPRETSFG